MAIDTHGVKGKPWVGFDLDGTLATYDHWHGIQHIGEPVKPMCDLIKKLRDEGKAVKILTARVAPKDGDTKEAAIARAFIAKWCKDNLGFVPPITHEKDSLMETLYDDRVKAVEQNTGKVLNMAKFKIGDKVKDTYWGGRYTATVKGVVPGARVQYVLDRPVGDDPNNYVAGEDEIVAANSSACNSTNPIVRKAMNAQYEYHTYLVPVIRKGKKDYVTIFRVADEETAKKLVDVPSYRNIGVTVDETRPVKVARNAVGRDKQDAGEVETWVNMFRNFIDWHLPKYKDMEKARKSGEQIIKYVEACLGSEGGKAQLRKMGWTVQKMRETMEKAIASRKGSNAACNAARSRNAVVQKALNAATARNFTPTSEFEVGDKVRFRDSVRSVPHDETYTVVKVSGKNITIKGGRDGGTSVEFANNLEPVFNAARARNADNPHDIDAHGKKLVKGDWVRFLKDMPDVKKGECALVKYALPGGLIFSTLAGAREISWDASVVEKMPPIPWSLSQIDAWKKGPRA